MLKFFSGKNVPVLILCFIYLAIGASQPLRGDFANYAYMAINGFMSQFDNQPFFSIYMEFFRHISPTIFLFFVSSSLPLLALFLTKFLRKGHRYFIISAELLYAAVLLFLVMPSASFYFLFRQNLASLIYLILGKVNLPLAMIVSSGFHLSIILPVLIAYALSIFFHKFPLKGLIIVFLPAMLFMISYSLSYLSTSILQIFSESGNNIFITYSSIYSGYSDTYSDMWRLYTLSFLSVLVFAFLERRRNINFPLSLCFYFLIGATMSALLFNWSQPIAYRYLQFIRLPSIIILANALSLLKFTSNISYASLARSSKY